MNIAPLSKTNGLEFGHISWRYYHKIKKKAMEQEFSWSGFLVSMSIAFFIVIIAALGLNLVHKSIAAAHAQQESAVYQTLNASFSQKIIKSIKKL